MPFSRLSLTAQLELLSQPVEHSWTCCVPLNPFLETWRARAARSRLEVSPWPRSAARWFSGSAYARRFLDLVPPLLSRTPPGLDDYNRDLRREIGLREEDWFILQPTRVVQRKGIEHAVEHLAKDHTPAG